MSCPQPKDLHFAKKCRQERRICTRKSPKDMLLPIFLPNQSSSTRSCTLLPDREAPRTFRVDVLMYILLDMIFITFKKSLFKKQKQLTRSSIELFKSPYSFICTYLCFLHRLYLLNADSDSECPSWTL